MTAPAPRLLVVGDVHTRFEDLEAVVAHGLEHGADGILLVGDLACAGWKLQRTETRKQRYRELVDKVLETTRASGLPVFMVPGNHDLPELELPENIDARAVELGGLRIAGMGGAGPRRFGFAYEWSELQAQVALHTLPACDVLLAHCPPIHTELDQTASGKSAGSQAVLDWALKHDGVLCCGHIHEAPGVQQLGRCLCVNAGGLGRPHGRLQAGWIVGRDLVAHVDLVDGVWSWLERDAERKEDVRPPPALSPAAH